MRFTDGQVIQDVVTGELHADVVCREILDGLAHRSGRPERRGRFGERQSGDPDNRGFIDYSGR